MNSIKRLTVIFWFMFATHCRTCFVHVYYMHVVKLVSFMFIAFDKAYLLFNDWLNQKINYRLVIIANSLQMMSSMTRLIIICFCSRLTDWTCHWSKLTVNSCLSSKLIILVIQAVFFLFSFKYSVMNEFQLIFSCFQTCNICSILSRHIVHVSFCLQYISSCCYHQCRE